MPKGLLSEATYRRLAEEIARLPNRPAHQRLMAQLYALGCAKDRAEYHRGRIWVMRAQIHRDNPELGRRIRLESRAARAATKAAAGVESGIKAQHPTPCQAPWFPGAHQTPPMLQDVAIGTPDPEPLPEPIVEWDERLWGIQR